MNSSRHCSAYGLSCSIDFEWPWCPSGEPRDALDLRLHLGDLGRYAFYPRSDYQDHLRQGANAEQDAKVVRILRGADRHFRIEYVDGADFVIDATASEIFGASRGELTRDDLLVYLQGPVLGFALRLRGVTCLHASAVAVNGRAFAVVGQQGMGKSTSAGAFARLGLPVLTDDVLALKDQGTRFQVQPGLPRVLLWPESVQALWGDPEALPQVVPTWPKRYLDLQKPGYHFAGQATPLEAIYVLSERSSEDAPTQISPLTGTQGLLELIGNTYGNELLDIALRAQELELLARLVSCVPIRRVQAPDNRGAIGEICQAILADFKSFSCSQAGPPASTKGA